MPPGRFLLKPDVLPTFGLDPVSARHFIERAESCVEARLVSSKDLLLQIGFKLHGAAHEWWCVNKRQQPTWEEFKREFLRVFGKSASKMELRRKLREREQRPDEPIWEYAFEVAALCREIDEDVQEGRIVHAVLD